MPSFEVRVNGAGKRKSAREHDEEVQRGRADSAILIAENEEKQRVEMVKRSPEHKKILEFVRGNDFMTAMRMYAEKCGNSWQVGTGRYKNEVVRRVDFVDKLFGWQDEIKKAEILRDVEFSERFSFEEKFNEYGIPLPVYVVDPTRPSDENYEAKFELSMPSSVDVSIFLRPPQDPDDYIQGYYGEQFQLFFNPEEIDKDVEYEYIEIWDQNSFSGSKSKAHKSRGHLFLPKGIIVRGLFKVPHNSISDFTTKVYKNLTQDQFFDYIADRIVASGK